MTKYYTLAIREDDGIWAEQFGDYDLDVVRGVTKIFRLGLPL